jgi:hypothetical protein
MERLQKQVFKDTHFPPLRILYQRSLIPKLAMLQLAWQSPSLKPPPAPQTVYMILTFLLRSSDQWLLEEMDAGMTWSPCTPWLVKQ